MTICKFCVGFVMSWQREVHADPLAMRADPSQQHQEEGLPLEVWYLLSAWAAASNLLGLLHCVSRLLIYQLSDLSRAVRAGNDGPHPGRLRAQQP